MTDPVPAAVSSAPVGVPKHLWMVGGVALLWNAMGAFDYLMTQTQNESYMSDFSAAQVEYFTSFPAWAVAFWAIAVWGGVLGSVLLLFRKTLAVPVFLVAFVAMVVMTIYNFLLSDGLEHMGGAFEMIFTALIFIVALLLWRYAVAMRAKGVLR